MKLPGKANYKLNKQNPIVKKLMELNNAMPEYFALKQCETAASLQNNEISKIIESNQGLIKPIVEYEKESSDDRKERSKNILFA